MRGEIRCTHFVDKGSVLQRWEPQLRHCLYAGRVYTDFVALAIHIKTETSAFPEHGNYELHAAAMPGADVKGLFKRCHLFIPLNLSLLQQATVGLDKNSDGEASMVLRRGCMASQSRLQKDITLLGSPLLPPTPPPEERRGLTCSISYECAFETEAAFLKTLLGKQT